MSRQAQISEQLDSPFHLVIDGDSRDIAFSTLREAENAVSGLVRPGRTISIVDGRTKKVVRRYVQ